MYYNKDKLLMVVSAGYFTEKIVDFTGEANRQFASGMGVSGNVQGKVRFSMSKLQTLNFKL